MRSLDPDSLTSDQTTRQNRFAINELKVDAELVAVVLRKVAGITDTDMEVDPQQAAIAHGRDIGRGHELVNHGLSLHAPDAHAEHAGPSHTQHQR
ncbi:hypothetical protein [Bradyrhizobium sp. STM 3843]|uniref:hypothetical protein n=1 Tax=Bradyrhizobium sp. STM 3843 TaxID=551947 RepID=UPI00158663AE|nr:hypothetical protein [Bradyrhizobium sp. STM 3843]